MIEQLLFSRPETADRAHNDDLRRRFRSGELLRLRPGVYCPADSWAESWPSDRYVAYAVAVARGAPATSFAVETAAALWGYPLTKVPGEVVLRARTKGNTGIASGRLLTSPAQPGLRAPRGFGVRRRHLPQSELVRIDNLGVCVPSRTATVVECAAYATFADAVVVMDAARTASRAGHVADDDLLESIARIAGPRRRARAQRVFDFSSTRSASPGESFSRVRIHQLGYQPPRLQEPIRDKQGRFADVDFYWDGARVAGEFDGWQKYTRGAVERGVSEGDIVAAEKVREDRIRRTGRSVARWLWRDLVEPERLRRILDSAGVPRR
ncbi:hypothetical protein BJH93_14275 [Kocuria polaris]|nr:hypothetical protein [Kocuria polaris]